jgi:hypothetical protein
MVLESSPPKVKITSSDCGTGSETISQEARFLKTNKPMAVKTMSKLKSRTSVFLWFTKSKYSLK